MKRSQWQVLGVIAVLLVSMILAGVLCRINVSSPRISLTELADLTEVPDGGPFLLEVGRITENADGSASYLLSFHYDGDGFLYFPRMDGARINGSRLTEQMYRGYVAHLSADGTNHGDYRVEIDPEGGFLSPTVCSVYFGTERQISDFIGVSLEGNAYLQGFCFAIVLLSMVLYLFKPSEKYLVWLALLAFFRGSYYRFNVLLGALTWMPVFSFLNEPTVYLVLFELLAAFFQYQLLKSFVSVKLGKISLIWYACAAVLPVLILHAHAFAASVSSILFFAVVYLGFLICFLRLPDEAAAEKMLLIISWGFTVVLRMFDEFCELGLIPVGDINLKYRLRGFVSVIFILAFFVVVGKRFAQKFQEADDLNVHLEEEIRRKAQQQTLFVRSMLHNLKTPLFSLGGYSDMALASLEKDPGRAAAYMKKTREKAIFAGELMDHIFLVTQMQSDMVHMQFAPVNLSTLLKAVSETPTSGMEARHLDLQLEVPENLYLQGDQLYLRQAFQNILDNARINTPDGGSIRIWTEQIPGLITVHIADTGYGIAEEDLGRIFDAYYSNRHEGQKSSGLGLYITNEIVRRHHGTISVRSRPGEGADFAVQLPCESEPLPSEKI